MSPEEVVETQSPFVFMWKRELQNFHLWGSEVPFTMFGAVNQMRSVCAMLCNFQNSIISA